MKKRIALFLCVVMVFSLCACNKAKNEGGEVKDNVVTEAPAKDSNRTADNKDVSAADEVTPIVTEAPVSEQSNDVEFVAISLCNHNRTEWTDDYEFVKYDLEYQTAFVSADMAHKYPELDKALKEFSERQESAVLSNGEWFDETYALMYADSDPSEEEYYEALFMDSKFEVARSDSRAVSLVEHYSDYTGGIHGNYGTYGTNFDTQTGAILKIADIVSDTDKLAGIVAEGIANQYPDTEFFVDSVYEYINFQIENDVLSYSLGYDGLTVMFNPYEIASYADGILSVTVYFSDYADLFNERYLDVPERYMINMPGSNYLGIAYTSYDGSHRTVSISPSFYSFDEYEEYDCFKVISDDNEADALLVESWGWDIEARFVSLAFGEFLLIESTGASDVTTLYVIALYDKPQLIQTMDITSMYGEWLEGYDVECYASVRLYDPSNIILCTREDMIGTNFWTANFFMEENGELTRTDDYFHATYEWPFKLKQTISIPEVDFVSGALTGRDIEVSEGTEIRMIRTDGYRTVDCEIGETGQYLRLELNGYPSAYDPDDWVVNQYYQDIYFEELFEGISYAG